MDLASDEARLRLAEAQLAIHGKKLSGYNEDARIERRGRTPGAGLRTVEHWRAATLPMDLLYDRAAVEFWGGVAKSAAGPEAAGKQDGPES